MTFLCRLSDTAEYGVVALVFGLILVPIYLHVSEFGLLLFIQFLTNFVKK